MPKNKKSPKKSSKTATTVKPDMAEKQYAEEKPHPEEKSRGILSHKAALPAVIAILLSALYAFTISEHVSLEDSGAFIAVADSAGIAHPPGYPLYTMLGKLFTLIPVENIAFRVKFLSAVAGAFAGVCIYFCCLALFRERWQAFLCAMFFGVCGLPWNLSVIAEVYTLHALFYFLLLYIALRLYDNFNRRDLYLWVFFFGLSLSHHWPLMVLGSISFIPILFGKEPGRRIFFVLQKLPQLTGLLLLGLLPYLYLVIRSRFEPYITAFGPVSLDQLPAYALRSRYASVDVNPTATSADSFLMLWHFMREYVREAGIIGAISVMAGMVAAVFSKNRRVITFALFLGFVTTPAILLAFLHFDYDILRRQAYMTYQIVPFGIGAIFISYALSAFGKRFRLPPVAVLAFGAFVCVFTFAANFGANNMRGNTMAFDYAKAVLNSLPKNAALFLYADTDIGPLSYAHTVAGVRPDVGLYSSFSYMFGNRLYDFGSNPAEVKKKLQQFLQKEKRLFVTARTEQFNNLSSFPVRDHGLFYEISLLETKSPITTTRQLSKEFLDKHLNDPYDKIWTYHRQVIVGDFCRTLLLWGDSHPIFEKHTRCKYQKALKLALEGDHTQAVALFREVIADSQIAVKTERIKLYEQYTSSSIKVINDKKTGDGKEKLQFFQKLVDDIYPSVSILPACENKVLSYLLQIRSQVDVNIGFNKLRDRFGGCKNLRPLFKKTAEEIKKSKNPSSKL